MAVPFTFRSAFHGFHREDVIHYIEYLTAKHTAQVNELNAEIEFLRGQLEPASADPDSPEQLLDAQLQAAQQAGDVDAMIQELEAEAAEEAPREDKRSRFAIPELQAKCAALEEELAQIREQGVSVEVRPDPRVAELEARCAALEKERDDALAALEQARQTSCTDHTALELEAYRRAERTERVARERAEQIYHKTNGVLSQATLQVDGAASEIGQMADRVVEHLKTLQEAVLGSRQALADAAQTMYALRPEGEA